METITLNIGGEAISLPNTTRAMERYATETVRRYELAIAREGHNASRALADTVDWTVSVDGTVLTISLQLQEYWKYLEYGRRAGKKFPPPQAIWEWVQAKGITSRPGKNGRVPTTKQLAYLIGRRIKEHGIPATNLLQNTLTEVHDLLYTSVEDAIRRDLSDWAVFSLNATLKA